MATTGVTPCMATFSSCLRRLAPPPMHLVGAFLEERGRKRLAGDHVMRSGVDLEGPDRRHHDRRVGLEARGPALDVEEALRAHVGAEARLGDEEVAGVDPDEIGDHRRVPVGDVPEGPGVDEHRRVLERLEEVRLDGVAHHHGHGSRRPQLLGGHRLAATVYPTTIAPQAVAHVPQRRRQGQHRHDLGGGGDVEPGLAGDPVLGRAQADHEVAQSPVVDVEHATPRHVVQVDPELVAVVEVVVEHGRQEVVGGGDGVHVPGEMEVERLERHRLAVPASRRAALDAEGRAHRRLADGDGGALGDMAHGLAETERRGGLPLAERRGRDGRDDHVSGTGPIRERLDGVEVHLGHVLAVGLEQPFGDARLGGDLGDGLERGPPRDLQRAQSMAMSVSLVTSLGADAGVRRVHGPPPPWLAHRL